MECTIKHRETCLPDYAQRCYDIAIPVDGESTIGDVIDQLDTTDPLGCDDWSEAQHEAYDAAIARLRAENAKALAKRFDPLLHVYGNHDSSYAYFDVDFTN